MYYKYSISFLKVVLLHFSSKYLFWLQIYFQLSTRIRNKTTSFLVFDHLYSTSFQYKELIKKEKTTTI